MGALIRNGVGYSNNGTGVLMRNGINYTGTYSGGGGGGNAQSLELDLIPNTFIDNGGVETSYNGWTSTDFIDISAYSTLYTIMLYDNFNAFYDANKTFISMFSTTSQVVIVPTGAVYARFSDPTSNMSSAKVFAEL